MKKLIIATMMAALALPVLAGSDDLKKNFEKSTGMKAESVTKTDISGLYEVYSQGNIFYTDEAAKNILVDAKLIDPAAKKNLTEERLSKLNTIDVSALPTKQAIKIVKGKGERTLYTFEDPNCGYCKKLAKEIAKIDNLTVYTFPLPILSPESLKKTNQILCSKDPAKAWTDFMLDNKAPEGAGDCAAAENSEKNKQLGIKYNIRGTPTIFFADGSRSPGAMPADQIEARLKTNK